MILRKSIFISFSKLSNLITEEIIMFKKILSLAIVAMMLMSLIAVGASAAQVEVADEAAAADDVAAQGAEADVAASGMSISDDGVIGFDSSTCGWESASSVLFYIHEIGGDELAAWGSKKKLGGELQSDGKTWLFNAKDLGVVDGKQYGLILENYDTLKETYDLLLDTSCYGDTVVVDPNKSIENPVDSNKSSLEARWSSGNLGPILQITSIGNLVGEAVPSNSSKYQMFVNFLASKGKDGLSNALNYNGKDAQTTIDETAAALGLTQADVKKALEEAKTTGDGADHTGDWDASKSSLPAGESGGSTSGDTSSKSSGSTSTSSKSGSASNTQTGQEENILFIMLGVMVLAAGVIFFVRKKERA